MFATPLGEEFGDGLVVGLLVEVEAGFVAGEEVDLEVESVHLDGNRLGCFGVLGRRCFLFWRVCGQAFGFSGGQVEALDDFGGLAKRLQGGFDLRQSLFYAEGGYLEGADVFVLVDD